MANPVPVLDLRATYDELRDELDEAYRRVMESGWYILGEEVEQLEAEYAAYCGVPHAIMVGNGLDALHLILRAYGVGPGDEVIVPSNTYIATWLAVTFTGATVVPVEPDLATYNLDPQRVNDAVTPRTRVIMPVHLYGQPADVDPLMDIAARHGLAVVEDAAQSQGARYHGRGSGALGHAAGTSFYPGKNLGAYGDAGAVTTHDDAIAASVRVLRNYGSKTKYRNEVIGYNSRLDPMQAAFLRVKLRHLDAWNERRRRVANRYVAAFAGLPELVLPAELAGAESVWHQFVIRVPNRDAFQRALHEQGIGTLIHYPVPPHLQPAYASLGWKEGAFPISEKIHREVLSLPIGPHLSENDQERVIDAVMHAVRSGVLQV